LGAGGLVVGFLVWAVPPNPQTPNPQSPIPNPQLYKKYYKLNLLFLNKYDIKLNKYDIKLNKYYIINYYLKIFF
jgi:hypothetical protein